MPVNFEKELVASCMNYNTLLQYLKEKHGDIGFILNRYEHSEEYISDPNNWISWASAKRLVLLIKQFLNNNDPRFMYDIGIEMPQLGSVGALEYVVRLFPSPKSIVVRIPTFNRRFNRLYEMDISEVQGNSAILTVKYREDFRSTFIYEMCTWNKGIVASIPQVWDLPPMEIKDSHCIFTIDEMLKDNYGYLSIPFEVIDDDYYLGEELIAKRVPSFQEINSLCYITTQDLVISGVLVLEKGVIYGSPFCKYNLIWQNKSFLKNLNDLTFGRMINAGSSRTALEEQLKYTEKQFFEIQRLNNDLREYADNLEELVQKRTKQLVAEEKKRRIYQVRAAQADAVARFLHQTSNLVLQPLASTMIVFEDFLEIIEEVKSEWGEDRSEDNLFVELDQSLERIQQVYPTAQQVIRGYRELFHAFYEIYVSTKPERDLNQDLRYIETLVKNKYILTEVDLKLELDPDLPLLKLEGGVQSIFLELMHNAARHGAKNILVKIEYDETEGMVYLAFYNDGEPIPEEHWAAAFDQEVSDQGRGFGMADARYILETINGGQIRFAITDRNKFQVMILISLPTSDDQI